VNWVEVIVVFQPAPVPRVSWMVSGTVYVGVESPLSRFAEKAGVALVERLRVVPVSVPVAVALAPRAVAGRAQSAAPKMKVAKSCFRRKAIPSCCRWQTLFAPVSVRNPTLLICEIELSSRGESRH
jgi:hypothetical protein